MGTGIWASMPLEYTIKDHNPYEGLVAGHWYKVITFNSEFEFWFPRKLKRNRLKEAALEFIGRDTYELDDIDSVREIKSPE